MNAVPPKIKTVSVSEEVAGALAASSITGETLVLPPQLDRKLYVQVDKVLNLLGGTWNRRAKAHVFAGKTPEQIRASIEAAVSTGRTEGIVDRKATLQLYETPTELAMKMAKKAVLPGSSILEPSAGTGRLALAALLTGAHSVHCIDIDAENCAALLRLREKAQGPPGYLGVTHRDFLTLEPRRGEHYDGVLMNPPFRQNQDIAHVRHAARFLRPGSVLCSVMSPHAFFAQDRPSVEFRAWLARQDVHRVEELPAGTFSEEGTDVHTRLLTVII